MDIDKKIQKPNAYFETLPEPDLPKYEFVTGNGDITSRSHAMKSYWRDRKIEQRRQKDTRPTKPSLRPLLSSGARRKDERNCPNQFQFQPTEDTSSHLQNPFIPNSNTPVPGIPEQLLSGIRFALSPSLGQEAKFRSIQISAHHHRHFYHWLSMHADALHSGLKFTPFRDIWLPLDLSNAASFNGILAHAAADLNGRREDAANSETLKFKTEAIATINLWLSTSPTAIKDEVFAGVVRLLTFEVC
ncbi:fungal-specific transcription factor domain-containing protein [Penicillium waksmanii]|uniref:fungal-specific transcription factor domain-containing protein n=1 Tax=Penicillium waksmanii TaxID=69791 RepID=UPI0025472C4B|nr:fungal-specific transcription factor domain-containing protein [Penicillium waksmanii]KAJ5976624.1 fungal-specific transcription factor domain-containing protein [Penicillium waksmanii]